MRTQALMVSKRTTDLAYRPQTYIHTYKWTDGRMDG